MHILANSFEQNTTTFTEPRSNFGEEGGGGVEIGEEKFKSPHTMSRTDPDIFLTTTQHPHTCRYTGE